MDTFDNISQPENTSPSNISQDINQEEDLEQLTGRPIANPLMIDEWHRWFLSQKPSLNTLDMYHSFIKRYVGEEVMVGQKSIDRFRDEHMGTVSSSALKSFLRFLVRKKGFPESLLTIKFEKNKQARKLPKVISTQEVQKIIDGMSSLSNKLLTQTLYSLALRVEEGLKLLWEDFNWDYWITHQDEYGTVTLKHTKRDKFRVLPVSPELMRNLYDNNTNKNDAGMPRGKLVFGDSEQYHEMMKDKQAGKHLNGDQIEARNRKTYYVRAKKAYSTVLSNVSKATIGRHISPHVFRHSKAQHLFDSGMTLESIQQLLGHSSIVTTQIYAQASPERVKADLKKFDTPIQKIDRNDVHQTDKALAQGFVSAQEAKETVVGSEWSGDDQIKKEETKDG